MPTGLCRRAVTHRSSHTRSTDGSPPLPRPPLPSYPHQATPSLLTSTPPSPALLPFLLPTAKLRAAGFTAGELWASGIGAAELRKVRRNLSSRRWPSPVQLYLFSLATVTTVSQHWLSPIQHRSHHGFNSQIAATAIAVLLSPVEAVITSFQIIAMRLAVLFPL